MIWRNLLVLLLTVSVANAADQYLTDDDKINAILFQLRGMSYSRYGEDFVHEIDRHAEKAFVNDKVGKQYLSQFSCAEMYAHIDTPEKERPYGAQYANFAADPLGYTLQYYYVLFISEELSIFRILKRSRLYNELSRADNFVMTVDDGVEISLKQHASNDKCDAQSFWRLYNVIGAHIVEDYITVLGHAAVEHIPYQYFPN